MKTNYLFAALLLWATACGTDDPTPSSSPPADSGKEGKGKGTVTSYLVGSASDVNPATQAGLILMGGGPDVDQAMAWMLARSGGGDIIVIRSSGSNGYNSYLYNMANVNSVETIIIDSRSDADNAEVENKIRNAEALFIAGGDQYDYIRYWKDTRTEAAINYLANTKKVPIGGTSAGLAILGQYYYGANEGTVYSDEALGDPYHRYMNGLGSGFLQMPFLANIITDSHYGERDRFGRHFAFLARLVKDFGVGSGSVKGIGVDEETAACIDENGLATIYGTGDVYFLKGSGRGGAEVCSSRTPLTWNRNRQAVTTQRVSGTSAGSNTFNLATWSCGSGCTQQYWWAERGSFTRD
jgi:cyanophycinase